MTRQPAWEYFSCPVRESLALRAGTSQLDDEEALVSPFSGLPGFDDCFAGTNLARIRAFFGSPLSFATSLTQQVRPGRSTPGSLARSITDAIPHRRSSP